MMVGRMVLAFGSLVVWAHAAAPTGPVEAFLGTNSAFRVRFSEGRMVALYGAPLMTDTTGMTSTALVAQFLAQHADALGVTGVALEFVRKTTIRNGELEVHQFRQRIAGENLTVHGSSVHIVVLLSEPKSIGYAGIQLVPLPTSALPSDSVVAGDATTAVLIHPQYSHISSFGPPEKVIYETEGRTLHRAWRFTGSDDNESYLFFTSTSGVTLLGVENQVQHATIKGTVSGHANLCLPRR